MPAIHLFQRRTFLGGDDLQLPCIATISLRLLQLIVFLLPIALHLFQNNNNRNNNIWDILNNDDNDYCHILLLLLFTYVVTSTIICLSSIVLELYLYRVSSMGCPTINTQERSSKVEYLLKLKLLLFGIIAQIIVVCLGIAVIVYYYNNDGSTISCNETAIDDDNSNNSDNNYEYYDAMQEEGYVMQDDKIERQRLLIAEKSGDDFWSQTFSNNDDESYYNSMLLSASSSSSTSTIAFMTFCTMWITQIMEIIAVSIFLRQLLSKPKSSALHLERYRYSAGNNSNSNSSNSNNSDNDDENNNILMSYHNAPTHNHALLTEELWTERCTSLCQCLGMSTCFLFGGKNIGSNNYFGAVARALSDYFEHGNTLDLVPSDIVMGLMILRVLQKQRTIESRQEVKKVFRQSFLRNASSLSIPSSSSNGNSNSSSAPPSDTTTNLLIAAQQQQQPQNDYLSSHLGSSSTFSFPKVRRMKRNLACDKDTPFYEPTTRTLLDLNSNEFDRFTLQEGTRFARYQMAIYTWMMYVYMHPVTGLARLLLKSGCGCASSSSEKCCNRRNEHDFLTSEGDVVPSGLVIGDNWCKVHKAALLLHAGINDTNATELIYAQLHSSFSDIPYCIIVDHAWKSVVLAIRGTFSLEDCVTDVLIEPESLQELADEFGFDCGGPDQYCHGGIMTCARIVYRDLQRHGILDKLLSNREYYPDYTLRIVGHSLGGGTATLLSYMLRPKFPSLRCITYSPPGCSFTWEMATKCRDWCHSFVLGSDLVPRLSVDTLELLRDEVLNLIGRVKVPKAEVARKTALTGLFTSKRKREEQRRFSNENVDNVESGDNDTVETLSELIDSILLPPPPSPLSIADNDDDIERTTPPSAPTSGNTTPVITEFSRSLDAFRKIQQERRQIRKHRSIKLYPPGQIVHFMKTGEVGSSVLRGMAKCMTCCTTNFGTEYTPIRIQNDDLNEIVISSTMGTDHFPPRMVQTMTNLSEQYGVSPTSPSPNSSSHSYGC